MCVCVCMYVCVFRECVVQLEDDRDGEEFEGEEREKEEDGGETRR